MSFFRQLRILILLLILFAVAMSTWLTQLRTTDWDRPLTVAIYPINGDGSRQTQDYVAGLSVQDFADIEDFFSEEAAHYRLPLKQPFEMVLGPVLTQSPPAPPYDRNLLGVIWWSLKMRYWAKQIKNDVGPPAQIQMFVRYFAPQTHKRLEHSLGLKKGLLGVVNAFAHPDYTKSNNVVIAHEMLHTVGASDKYNPATGQPLYPAGFAKPEKEPLYPQEYAEIMGGRIPVSEAKAVMPEGLEQSLIGVGTAREIRWLE
jgi:hypothetical protein